MLSLRWIYMKSEEIRLDEFKWGKICYTNIPQKSSSESSEAGTYQTGRTNIDIKVWLRYVDGPKSVEQWLEVAQFRLVRAIFYYIGDIVEQLEEHLEPRQIATKHIRRWTYHKLSHTSNHGR